MATFSVYKGNFIYPVRNDRVRTSPEAASQTFIVGNPLIFATAANKGDQVKISGSDPAAGTVVGFAACNASGVEGTPVTYWPLDEQAEFAIHVQDTGALDADDLSGVEYGIVADGTNLIWRLDLTETTAKVFRVVDYAKNPATGAKFAAGDVNGAYICTAAAGVQGLLRK